MSALLGGPEVNKFEQVSSDGYQMSLGGTWGAKSGRGCCPVGSNASWVIGVIITWEPLPNQIDGQTRLKTLPSRNFVGGR